MNADPFSPCRIGTLELANRFVMSAAVEGMDKDLAMRVQYFTDRAAGGVGLIIAGRLGNQDTTFGRVVESVHRVGGKIALQVISHRGLGFHPHCDVAAPSVVALESPIFSPLFPAGPHHEASEAEIAELISDYASAARHAKELGVDAIQVHAAHNSALMPWLSPLTNKRTDRWGGSIEDRVRVHQEVYGAIRAEVGKDFPIMIKLGVADPFEGGLSFAEGLRAATILADTGYDALEISQGLQDYQDLKTWKGTPMHLGVVTREQEAYFRPWCAQVKASIAKPTIMSGGMRSLDLIEEVLSQGETDLVGMCRPLIREPQLIRRWQGGDRRKATCVSCNKCGLGLMRGLPLACYLQEPWTFDRV